MSNDDFPDQEDFPLIEIEHTANKVIDAGGFIYQTWKCGGCGKRVTANNKNMLTIKGHHEECDFTTDLLVTGCNCVAFLPGGKSDKED